MDGEGVDAEEWLSTENRRKVKHAKRRTKRQSILSLRRHSAANHFHFPDIDPHAATRQTSITTFLQRPRHAMGTSPKCNRASTANTAAENRCFQSKTDVTENKENESETSAKLNIDWRGGKHKDAGLALSPIQVTSLNHLNYNGQTTEEKLVSSEIDSSLINGAVFQNETEHKLLSCSGDGMESKSRRSISEDNMVDTQNVRCRQTHSLKDCTKIVCNDNQRNITNLAATDVFPNEWNIVNWPRLFKQHNKKCPSYVEYNESGTNLSHGVRKASQNKQAIHGNTESHLSFALPSSVIADTVSQPISNSLQNGAGSVVSCTLLNTKLEPKSSTLPINEEHFRESDVVSQFTLPHALNAMSARLPKTETSTLPIDGEDSCESDVVSKLTLPNALNAIMSSTLPKREPLPIDEEDFGESDIVSQFTLPNALNPIMSPTLPKSKTSALPIDEKDSSESDIVSQFTLPHPLNSVMSSTLLVDGEDSRGSDIVSQFTLPHALNSVMSSTLLVDGEDSRGSDIVSQFTLPHALNSVMSSTLLVDGEDSRGSDVVSQFILSLPDSYVDDI